MRTTHIRKMAAAAAALRRASPARLILFYVVSLTIYFKF